MLPRLFTDTRFGFLWLIIRVWLGYEWLSSGLGKLTNPQGVWIGEKGGTALKGFLMKAAGMATAPDGSALPAAAKYGWYQGFARFLVESNSTGWFSYVIVFGEILVGLGLILGLLTVLAAAGGAFMNLNFMLAGTASTNPVMYTLAILLILAGPRAGYYGLDQLWRKRRLAAGGHQQKTQMQSA